MKLKILVIILITICPFVLKAQMGLGSKISYIQIYNENLQLSSERKTSKDSLQLLNEINHDILKLHKKGFLTASIDSVSTRKDTLKIVFYQGKKFKWAKISLVDSNFNLLKKAGLIDKKLFGKPVVPQELYRMEDKVISYYVSNGYPFARIFLDSISIENEATFEAKVRIDQGDYFSFDSLMINEKIIASKKFLQGYFQIKRGAPYQQSRVDAISRLITQLPGLKEEKPKELYFKNNQYYIKLFLKNQKTGGVDGIVGFQQDKSTGKLFFTGHFDLNLQNISGSGKSFKLNWKKTDINSQFFNLNYDHLSLLRSKINFGLKYGLFKQDTSFIQRKPYVEFSYFDNNLLKFKFFYQLDDSRTIGKINSDNNNIVPSITNVRTSYYGLGCEFNNSDDIFWPTKGTIVEVKGSVGNKKILDNEVREQVENKTLQWRGEFSIEKYLKHRSNLGLFTGIYGSILKNNNLFLNEVFRLGGIRSLRGFRENRFYASEYLLGKMEARYYLENKSYFMIFADYAFYKNRVKGEKPIFQGPPLGLGAGLSLSTSTGIFSFAYAVGREGTNPLIFNNSVVNFGLTTQF